MRIELPVAVYICADAVVGEKCLSDVCRREEEASGWYSRDLFLWKD